MQLSRVLDEVVDEVPNSKLIETWRQGVWEFGILRAKQVAGSIRGTDSENVVELRK